MSHKGPNGPPGPYGSNGWNWNIRWRLQQLLCKIPPIKRLLWRHWMEEE